MTIIELIAASLVLSGIVAAVACLIGLALEYHVRDPEVRERLWGLALYAVATPPVVIGLSILMPAPSLAPGAVAMSPVQTISVLTGVDIAGPASRMDGETFAVALVGLAVLASSIRALSLAVRVARLRRLVRVSRPADAAVIAAVARVARRFDLSAPRVGIVADAEGPLLTGFRRPLLLLPDALAGQPDALAAQMVCAHELAHLQRGDHRALWVEEVLLVVFAANPAIRAIRDRRAAAREEACDALALSRTDPDARRVYARTLVEALRRQPDPSSQPALTFTSSKRNFVMNRLNAILKPVAPAGRRTRSATLAACSVLAALACTGSLAVAAQRQGTPAIIKPSVVLADASATVGLPAPVAMAPPAVVIQAAALTAATVAKPLPVPVPEVRTADPRVITNPTWAQTPQPQWPAQAADVSAAQVSLSCTAAPDGRVFGCSVLNEDPAGVGFGAAAIVAAEQAQLAGGEASAIVRFTIRFRKN